MQYVERSTNVFQQDSPSPPPGLSLGNFRPSAVSASSTARRAHRLGNARLFTTSPTTSPQMQWVLASPVPLSDPRRPHLQTCTPFLPLSSKRPPFSTPFIKQNDQNQQALPSGTVTSLVLSTLYQYSLRIHLNSPDAPRLR